MNGGYPLRPVASARTRPVAGIATQPGGCQPPRPAPGPRQSPGFCPPNPARRRRAGLQACAGAARAAVAPAGAAGAGRAAAAAARAARASHGGTWCEPGGASRWPAGIRSGSGTWRRRARQAAGQSAARP